MTKTLGIKVTLLKEGCPPEWCETLLPWLVAQTEHLLVAESLDEVLAQRSEAPPDILLLAHLPSQFDGFAAADRIRQLEPLLPLLFLAEQTLENWAEVVERGGLGLLAPPFAPNILGNALKRCQPVIEARRQELARHAENRVLAELFGYTPGLLCYTDIDGNIVHLNQQAAKVFGLTAGTANFDDLMSRFFSPHATDHPRDLEEAGYAACHWKGKLRGRSATEGARLYQVESQPLTLAEGTLGTLLTLRDITDEQALLARLRINLQAALDQLAYGIFDHPDKGLLPSSDPNDDSTAPPRHFSLIELRDEMRRRPQLAELQMLVPDYLAGRFSAPWQTLCTALDVALRGSLAYTGALPQIILTVKERSTENIGIQLSLRSEKADIPDNFYQTINDYLDGHSDDPLATGGLGQAAVLFEKLGGTLVIRGEKGKARTLICTLPLAVADNSDSLPTMETFEKKAPADHTDDFSHLRVLIAEDNPLEQITLKQILGSLGCTLVVVDNGKDAVNEFEYDRFDLLLMDILMPEMDGFEATRLIRERERASGGHTPVVALTSYALKAIHDRCVTAGMDCYLAKPVERNKLISMIRELTRPFDDQNLSRTAEDSDLGAAQTRQEPAIFDPQRVLKNLGGDIATFRELVDMYLNGFATRGEELAGLLNEGKLEDILSSTHALKGMAANLGGLRLSQICEEIQNLCRTGEQPGVQRFGERLRTASAELKAAMEQIDWSKLACADEHLK